MKNIIAILIFLLSVLASKALSESIQEMIDKASDGNPTNQYEVAARYEKGEGYVNAFQWYKKAADQNHQPAQEILVWMYLDGEGTEKNAELGTILGYKLASEGSKHAQRMMGLYHYGYFGYFKPDGWRSEKGPLQDKVDAVRWFQQAAEQKDGWSMYYLGKCYLKGDGISKNISKALAWMALAYSFGEIPYQGDLYSYEGLSADDIDTSGKLAKEKAHQFVHENKELTDEKKKDALIKLEAKIGEFVKNRHEERNSELSEKWKREESQRRQEKWGWLETLGEWIFSFGIVSVVISIIAIIVILWIAWYLVVFAKTILIGLSKLFTAIVSAIANLLTAPFDKKKKKLKESAKRIDQLEEKIAQLQQQMAEQKHSASTQHDEYFEDDTLYESDDDEFRSDDPDDVLHGDLDIEDFRYGGCDGDEAWQMYWNTH